MNTTIILVLIIVFSFVASRLLKRYFPAYFAFSGAEYLALGVVLGPEVTGFVSSETLVHLEPVISLLLGVVGFSLGLMFKEHVGQVKMLGPRLLTAAVSIAVPAVGCWAFLTFIPAINMASAQIYLLSATIGVTACVSSVTRIDGVSRFLAADGWVTRNLRSFSVVSDVVAVFTFGAISSVTRAEVVTRVGARALSWMEWLGASLLVGVLCGALFMAFIGKVRSGPHTFLATIGCVIFASGMATGLGVSPLFVSLVVGATLSTISPHASILRPTIQRLEHPTLVLLLIFAGVVWEPVSQNWLWAFVPLYIVLRFVALRLGAGLALALIRDRPPARRFGNGLLAQGVIAVGIAVDFTLLKPDSAGFVLTILLLAMLAQDFLSTRALRKVLADAEELYVDMRLGTAPASASEPTHDDGHHGHGGDHHHEAAGA